MKEGKKNPKNDVMKTINKLLLDWIEERTREKICEIKNEFT